MATLWWIKDSIAVIETSVCLVYFYNIQPVGLLSEEENSVIPASSSSSSLNSFLFSYGSILLALMSSSRCRDAITSSVKSSMDALFLKTTLKFRKDFVVFVLLQVNLWHYIIKIFSESLWQMVFCGMHVTPTKAKRDRRTDRRMKDKQV